MQTTACFNLLTVATLLWGLEQKCNAASLRVVPNRAQFFEYESVTFYCEAASRCQLVHEYRGKRQENTNKEEAAGPTHTIKPVYAEDSGKYWCDAGGGETSISISINVTAGSVILDIPALPVTEGGVVTLRCRNKTTSSRPPARFHKDGVFIGSGSTGHVSLHGVSRSDEGAYSCSVDGAGDSAESWLSVSDRRATGPSCSTAPWILVTVLLVALLSVLGLHFTRTGCGSSPAAASRLLTQRPPSDPAAHQTDGDGSSSRVVYHLLDSVDPRQLDPVTSAPSAATDPASAEDPCYATVLYRF